MGAELHITRADFWADNDDCQIGPEEWLAYVASDPELELDPRNGKYFARWRGESAYKEPWLRWSQGNISTKWPDTALYKKMLSIAADLGATVRDDDDRMYSEEGDWAFEPEESDPGAWESQRIDIDGAKRSLSVLGFFLAVSYVGVLLSLALIGWFGGPAGQQRPYDSLIVTLTLVSTVALLLCPWLIGLVATRIGKNGVLWGGLAFVFLPIGSLIGYFKIKAAVDAADGSSQYQQ